MAVKAKSHEEASMFVCQLVILGFVVNYPGTVNLVKQEKPNRFNTVRGTREFSIRGYIRGLKLLLHNFSGICAVNNVNRPSRNKVVAKKVFWTVT